MAVNLAQPSALPLPTTPPEQPYRRALDVAGASLLLLLALPLLLLGALLVLVGSGRPVFFGHRRVGRGGRPFRCWKLRTMTHGAELWLALDPQLRERHLSNGFKLRLHEDPRVTRVGRLLRRTHVDELPQLFNVLGGSMSLVGPRPVVEDELAHYGDAAEELLATRPGIFGAWTSRGRERPSYPERARLELAYVRTRSTTSDLRILLRSVPVVLRGQED
ncbi:MAG: sugar transferase [Gemmatimonadetes bacterium]|nr:sugar transferase [Gemmatimonadota bacterium]